MAADGFKENQNVVTVLVDEDGSALEVETSVANRDGGFVLIVHMVADGFEERIKT